MSQNQTRKIFKRTISSVYVLNCFKCFQIYILEQMSPKRPTRKLYQVFMYDILWQNVPILLNCSKSYTADALKALLSKNWFYFVFLIF